MSDIATNDALPALEIVAPFDILTLDTRDTTSSEEDVVATAPIPSAEDKRSADSVRTRAEATCNVLISIQHQLASWVLYLLEREQNAVRAAIEDLRADKCKKSPTTADRISAKDSLVTKTFTSESREYEDLPLQDLDNTGHQKAESTELTDTDIILILDEIHALSHQKLDVLWKSLYGQNQVTADIDRTDTTVNTSTAASSAPSVDVSDPVAWVIPMPSDSPFGFSATIIPMPYKNKKWIPR